MFFQWRIEKYQFFLVRLSQLVCTNSKASKVPIFSGCPKISATPIFSYDFHFHSFPSMYICRGKRSVYLGDKRYKFHVRLGRASLRIKEPIFFSRCRQSCTKSCDAGMVCNKFLSRCEAPFFKLYKDCKKKRTRHFIMRSRRWELFSIRFVARKKAQKEKFFAI